MCEWFKVSLSELFQRVGSHIQILDGSDKRTEGLVISNWRLQLWKFKVKYLLVMFCGNPTSYALSVKYQILTKNSINYYGVRQNVCIRTWFWNQFLPLEQFQIIFPHFQVSNERISLHFPSFLGLLRYCSDIYLDKISILFKKHLIARSSILGCWNYYSMNYENIK